MHHRSVALRSTRLSLLLMVIGISISACGFQLRGYHDQRITLEAVAISSEAQSALFDRTLKARLRERHIRIDDSAEWQLKILKYTERRRSISLNERAKAAEFELMSSLKYAIKAPGQLKYSKPYELRSSRIYLHDETKATGKAEEERLLRQEMLGALIDQMLRQLQQSETDNPDKSA